MLTHLIRAFIDVLFSPFVRAYIRQVAIKTPIFPGQVWNIPMIGEVLVVGITDETVSYFSVDSVYSVSRSEFVKHCKEPAAKENNVLKLHKD